MNWFHLAPAPSINSPAPQQKTAPAFVPSEHTGCDSVQKTAGVKNRKGRKPKWKSGPTTAIRIPAIFAEELMAIARKWDEGTHFPEV